MHIPVMLKETVDAIHPVSGGKYIDATLGGGGHSSEILKRSGPDGRLLGIDRDPDAVSRCRESLRSFGSRFTAVHSDFSNIADIAAQNGFTEIDGIIMDLGVSSYQLDEPERGFSFAEDGPLDMRMDPTYGQPASEYLASFGDDWKSLAKVLREYGEEKDSAVISKRIVRENAASPITTTGRLAEVVSDAVGGRRGSKRHPATKTFQAIRIAVNGELEEISRGVESAVSLLSEGGVLAVISFHSLEDRIVKRIFTTHEGRFVSLQQGGCKWEGRMPTVERVFRRPVTPSEEELTNNPRARSAKLRAVRRKA